MDYDKIARNLAGTEEILSSAGHWTKNTMRRPIYLGDSKYEVSYCLVGAQRQVYVGSTGDKVYSQEYRHSLRMLRNELRRGSLRNRFLVAMIGLKYFSLSERYERQIFALNDYMASHDDIITAIRNAYAKASLKSTGAQTIVRDETGKLVVQADHDLAAGPN